MTPSSQPMRHSADPTPATTAPAVADAAVCLSQGIELLRALSDSQYVANLPPTFASGLGAHVRHVIDHVDCLLEGLEHGRVNYDQRRREHRAETDRAYALELLLERAGQLAGLANLDANTPLQINSDTGSGTLNWTGSTLARECQFIVSHTTHHYALIAAILVHSGLPVPKDFGISPSTLRHRATASPR